MDGRKRCINASVDEKLFIRFQETENGGFRKRISVDRALVSYAAVFRLVTRLWGGALRDEPKNGCVGD